MIGRIFEYQANMIQILVLLLRHGNRSYTDVDVVQHYHPRDFRIFWMLPKECVTNIKSIWLLVHHFFEDFEVLFLSQRKQDWKFESIEDFQNFWLMDNGCFTKNLFQIYFLKKIDIIYHRFHSNYLMFIIILLFHHIPNWKENRFQGIIGEKAIVRHKQAM